MQYEHKTKPWIVLTIGMAAVIALLIIARFMMGYDEVSNYLEDIAGAITVIVLSVVTYEEWEGHRERKRYKASELMGINRVKDEVFRLLYQYAFVLNFRWDTKSEAMRVIDKMTGSNKFSRVATELHTKTAKHIYQEDASIRSTLFYKAREALDNPSLSKQTYRDADELITQTEKAIEQIDLVIAIYAHALTPETHKWALGVREALSQSITGKLSLLSIRLGAASSNGNKSLRDHDRAGLAHLITELIDVGVSADQLSVGM